MQINDNFINLEVLPHVSISYNLQENHLVFNFVTSNRKRNIF